MAMDMFFTIDSIKGESSDGTYKESIDVLAWSWGLTQSASAHQGSGGGSGKVSVHDLSFTKYIDKATSDLMSACASGKHLKDAKLVVRKAGGDAPLDYLKVTLEDVIVASVSTGGSGGEDRLTENVVLNFGKFTVEYNPQDNKGGGKGVARATWDIPANKKF
jgi:type VI secretion system secreted protein Hcp